MSTSFVFEKNNQVDIVESYLILWNQFYVYQSRPEGVWEDPYVRP